MQPPQNGQYDFEAQPRVVKARTKYRDAQDENFQPIPTQNLMFDKRVVRGNTYAAIVTTTREAGQQLKSSQRISSLKQTQRQQPDEQEMGYGGNSTPRAVEGRVHREVWTDDLVEILTDKPPHYEKDTQTDFFIERPVNRL
eukprot:CAMPEP_0176474214 /NCGR_PEP_ID=MMETSP0127-20121128/42852_1 /TAXON_ID=938130 /ORGANISM="Platyophrya macrostoma, Strain WH" /LENGTH=140 /DNA_ID=CAMNT_0017869525 /DNA_START=19 /DNA_END=437 /DNA_ORIENTATION=-